MYAVFSLKHQKHFAGLGWSDGRDQIRYYASPAEAQRVADTFNLALCQHDYEMARTDAAQINYVVDEAGNRHEPPPFVRVGKVSVRRYVEEEV